MDDWQTVTDAEPWRIGEAKLATVGKPARPFNPTREFKTTFPRLTTLLGSARELAVSLPKGCHQLFAWGVPDLGVRAWLCSAAPEFIPSRPAPDHRILLGCFGGITERFNEPSGNLLLNHYHALTADEVARDASFMADYSWAFEESDGIPINMAEYYPVAWEANGNCVLCSRDTGELLFFAPDHADVDLIPYDRCPMYTLHTHRRVGTLREWVEMIAGQWESHES